MEKPNDPAIVKTESDADSQNGLVKAATSLVCEIMLCCTIAVAASIRPFYCPSFYIRLFDIFFIVHIVPFTILERALIARLIHSFVLFTDSLSAIETSLAIW